MQRLTRRGVLAATLLASTWACQETPVDLPEATTVRSTPDALELMTGQQAAVAATVLDQDGAVLRAVVAQWVSDNPIIASVTADGQARANAVGTAHFVASYGQLADTVAVTVRANTLNDIATLDILGGDIVTPLGARVPESQLRIVDQSGRDQCAWVNPSLRYNDNVVSVGYDGDGCRLRVQPQRAGETYVVATVNGLADSLKVTVGEPQTLWIALTGDPAVGPTTQEEYRAVFKAGAQVTYQFTVRDATNRPLANTPVTFSTRYSDTPPTLAATSATTDAQGVVSVTATLPTTLYGFDGDDFQIEAYAVSASGDESSYGVDGETFPDTIAALGFSRTSPYDMESFAAGRLTTGLTLPAGTTQTIWVSGLDTHGNLVDNGAYAPGVTVNDTDTDATHSALTANFIFGYYIDVTAPAAGETTQLVLEQGTTITATLTITGR